MEQSTCCPTTIFKERIIEDQAQTKRCSKCREIKPINEFNKNKSKNDGYTHYCKKCKKESDHNNHQKHKIIHNMKTKQWRLDNPNKINQCPSRSKENSHKYNQTRWLIVKYNPDRKAKYTQYSNNRYHNNPLFHLIIVQKNQIRQIIRTFKNSGYKSLHTHDLLCCTSQFLKNHIEKQFTESMSWDNYGNKNGQWSIDHIIPRVFFDLNDTTEQRLCFHYGNLRPIWHTENMAKSDKIFQLNFIY